MHNVCDLAVSDKAVERSRPLSLLRAAVARAARAAEVLNGALAVEGDLLHERSSERLAAGTAPARPARAVGGPQKVLQCAGKGSAQRSAGSAAAAVGWKHCGGEAGDGRCQLGSYSPHLSAKGTAEYRQSATSV